MASAKPATAPLASAAGPSATLNTVPDVPMETITSPAPRADAERRGGVVARARAEQRAARRSSPAAAGSRAEHRRAPAAGRPKARSSRSSR